MSYQGSCHCGAVTFEVDADPPTQALSCNCSHCRRLGLLISTVPAGRVSVKAEEGAAHTYLFNRRVIRHQVCSTCGCEPLALGSDDTGAAVAAVNLRCVPSVALDSLVLEYVDGAARW